MKVEITEKEVIEYYVDCPKDKKLITHEECTNCEFYEGDDTEFIECNWKGRIK